MSVETSEVEPTECPVCGTPFRSGVTHSPTTARGDAGPGGAPEAVAYCPNPDCPSHAADRVDDPGGA